MATREQTAEMIKVMQHYVDGGEVQVDTETLDGWRDAKDPSFTFLLKWRIKPKPVDIWCIEILINSKVTLMTVVAFESKHEAETHGGLVHGSKFLRAVRFVQAED